MSATLRVDDFVSNKTLFSIPPPVITVSFVSISFCLYVLLDQLNYLSESAADVVVFYYVGIV